MTDWSRRRCSREEEPICWTSDKPVGMDFVMLNHMVDIRQTCGHGFCDAEPYCGHQTDMWAWFLRC